MRSLPGLRDKMVAAFAAFVVRIQEDYPEVIKDSLALLLRCGVFMTGTPARQQGCVLHRGSSACQQSAG
jgi:hypothetical protein